MYVVGCPFPMGDIIREVSNLVQLHSVSATNHFASSGLNVDLTTKLKLREGNIANYIYLLKPKETL